MSWEGVPWFVDGGEHGPEVARVLAYAASGGGEGVIGPGDCKVVPSAIPDGNIHINPGAVAVLNRFGGGEAQSYIARNVGDEVEALTPQGSSGERYDLIAVIIEDPQYPGQPPPVSVADGPYVRTAVYEDVPSSTRTLAEVDADQTGFALALVRFAASDGTVAAADITDLRRTLFNRSQTITRMFSVDAGTVNMSTSGLAEFPPGSDWDVLVPEWANKVALTGICSGIDALDDGADGGTANGHIRVTLGALTTDSGIWRANAVGPGRRTTLTAQAATDDLDVPLGVRGTVQTLTMLAYKSSGSGMTIRSTDGTTAVATVVFTEEVV